MPKKIKAVFFDLDGSTLVNGALVESFRLAVAKNQNTNWIFTTGRSITSIKNMGVHTGFNEEIPHIFDNGALVTSFHGDVAEANIIDSGSKKIALDYLENVYKSGVDFDYIFSSIYPNTAHVWSPNNSLLQTFRSINRHRSYTAFRNIIQSQDVLKISVKPSNMSDVSFPQALNVEQQKHSYDIVDPQASKGNAINAVRMVLNLSSDQVAFVCDDQNDISALRHPDLDDMLIIQVGDKISGERCNIRIKSPEEVGSALETIL